MFGLELIKGMGRATKLNYTIRHIILTKLIILFESPKRKKVFSRKSKYKGEYS